MNQQPDLFRKPVAGARATDPATSFEAARNAELSGRAASQRRSCLEEVRLNPGLTAAEIAMAVGLERHVPSRRLPELRDMKLVRNGPPRICRMQGSLSLTWWPLVQG